MTRRVLPSGSIAVLVAALFLGFALFFVAFAGVFNGSIPWIVAGLAGFLVAGGLLGACRPELAGWIPVALVAPGLPWVALFTLALVQEEDWQAAMAWPFGLLIAGVLSCLGAWISSRRRASRTTTS